MIIQESDCYLSLERDESELKSRLGRIYVPDERDAAYPLSAMVPSSSEREERTYRYWWAGGWWGNQGSTPTCVAYSWLHLIEDGPVTFAPRSPGAGPVADPEMVYREAQKIDRWPGENYAGTSVRAGAKVLQREGLISSYRWAWDLDSLVDALLYVGPVVLGTWWHRDMFYPDEDGFITPTGGTVGGHAYLANGVNVERRVVRIKNSWGRSWGKRGYAYLKFEDVEKLLDEQGEACIAEEVETR